jgi:quinol-cytochrome oxidoreductase complex cytochrome b subunit
VFFLITAYYEALPPSFALLAGFGDILTAIGALFVSKWISENKSWSRKATFVWNIFGLWDIVSVMISAIIITRSSIENNTQPIIEMTKIPFVWIPAFAPAVIIFLHIAVFKKLKRMS